MLKSSLRLCVFASPCQSKLVNEMLKANKLLFTLFLIIILWGGLFTYPAASQRIESRVNNLEFDINRLESRSSYEYLCVEVRSLKY